VSVEAAHQPSGFFVLRTPLLPREHFEQWGAAGTDGEPCDEAALQRQLRGRLASLVADPLVQEALMLASPTLTDSIPIWLDRPDGERGKKVERSLVKYLSRMCFRSTPFGLCAGVSLGTVGGGVTNLEIDGRAGHRRRSTLGFPALARIAARARERLLAAGDLPVQPNPTLHRSGGRLRLLQRVWPDDGGPGYQLLSAEASPELDRLLERAARGGASLRELVDELRDGDGGGDEALAFVHQLLEAGVLVGGPEPSVCGGDPLDDLAARLVAHPATRDLGGELRRAQDELRRLDDARPGAPAEREYRRLTGAPAAEAPEAPGRAGQGPPVHVDLVKLGPRLVISPALAEEIRRGAELLWRLVPPAEDALAAFRAELAERHGEAAVPLLAVLDEDLGIGFPPPEPEPRARFTEREAHLLRRVVAASAECQAELVLGPADVAALQLPSWDIPDAYAALAVVHAAAGPAGAPAEGPVAFVDSVDGPAGAALLGRFCRSLPGLEQRLRDHLRAEEACQPDAVFAEIVHLPSGAAFAGMSRPPLRTAEIPCFGHSGAPAAHVIPLADLTVAVAGRRVVLRSRRLGREVLPRLTAAHDDRGSPLPVYRFLRAVSRQDGGGGRTWQWGALEALDYLPRVRAGRVILALQRWRLWAHELEPACRPSAQRLEAVRQLRRRRGLPRLLAMDDGDNPMVVDLENLLSLDVLAHAALDRPSVTFQELPGGDQPAVASPEGGFCHEVVMPFARGAGRAARTAAAPARARTAAAPTRTFIPGSEWFYCKLYGGAGMADQVLCDLVQPLIEELSAQHGLAQWHFLRNQDPGHHLRLRLRLPGAPGAALAALHRRLQPFLGDGSVHRVVVDTYQRELERYGGPAGIALAERIFTADSEAALRWLAAARLGSGATLADERWCVLTAASDRLLRDFALSDQDRRTLLLQLATGYAAEGSAAGSERQVAAFFRTQRGTLERHLQPPAPGDGERAALWQALAARSTEVRAAAAQLRQLDEEGMLETSLPELVSALLHVQAGRLMRSEVRANEHLAFSCLLKLDRARLARRRADCEGERA
jgi:thiopeptide-type bacteriocin biosynthesis protein